jgi:hypothetical protein
MNLWERVKRQFSSTVHHPEETSELVPGFVPTVEEVMFPGSKPTDYKTATLYPMVKVERVPIPGSRDKAELITRDIEIITDRYEHNRKHEKFTYPSELNGLGETTRQILNKLTFELIENPEGFKPRTKPLSNTELSMHSYVEGIVLSKELIEKRNPLDSSHIIIEEVYCAGLEVDWNGYYTDDEEVDDFIYIAMDTDPDAFVNFLHQSIRLLKLPEWKGY